MQGSSENQQPIAEILGLGACLLAKNLAWWLLSNRSYQAAAAAAGFVKGGTEVATIDRILIYPVKSCSGVELQRADITPSGLVAPDGVRDRSYVILNELDDGRYVSLKAVPQLSAVRPILDPERPGHIRLSADGHPTVEVTPSSRTVQISFRSESLTGLDCGDEVAEWLNRVCGLRGFRLAFCPRGDRPEIMPNRMRQIGYAAEAAAVPVNPIAYADASPILLLSDSSLKHLNEVLTHQASQTQATTDWRSFRPNLLVAGAKQPHEEDTWDRLRICGSESSSKGSAQLSVVFPCERCLMVNLAYSPDGVATKPPGNPVLDALATYRSRRPQFRNPLFGANCAVLAPGPVGTGDRVFANKQCQINN